jgi:membrane protein DedA with SNARE-associated domain
MRDVGSVGSCVKQRLLLGISRKYGALSVVAGRLMTAIRSLIPMTVGASGTDRLTFTLADIAACFIWTAGLGLLVVGLNNVFS